MSLLRIKSDRILLGKDLFDGYLYLSDGVISDITAEYREAEEAYDFTGLFVAPGFIDLHTHGAGGHPFLTEDEEEVLKGCEYHLRHGTTTLLPTVSASPIQVMEKALSAIAKASKSPQAPCHIVGAHLEGPYLSSKQGGAQCTDFITPPQKEDYEALGRKYKGFLTRWTYAPEEDRDQAFTKFLRENGILASVGHSDATYQELKPAIDEGCQLVTHLYSCTSTVTRDHGFRSLGIIESAFLRDEMFVEIIADGKHLPKELVQMIVKIKSPERVALITDSLEIAGTDITQGEMGGTAYIVEDGVCKLKDRSAFAGSVATADCLVRFMTKECGFSLGDTITMICQTPARLLHLKKGEIQKGYDADLTVFDDEIQIKSVFVSGKKRI